MKRAQCVFLVVWVVLIAAYCANTQAYKTMTLDEAASTITSLKPPQKPDNDNLFYPDYSLWYRHFKPSWFDFILKYFSPSAIDTARYQSLFEAVIKQLKEKDACKQRVAQINHKSHDILIIVGDLQGSLESCIRDLDALKKQGIIDADLTIKRAHYKLIFNANVIGREPLNLQLLGLIASLMLKNPEQVWYVRGAYEESDWWQYSSLGQQLDALKSAGDVLKKLIMEWLGLLPYALYINYEQGQKLIRISGYSRNYAPLNERMFGAFFETPMTRSSIDYCINKRVQAQKNPHIKALICSNNGVDEFIQNKGLALLDFTGGSIAWSIFSAPTALHRMINDFHYDAFAMLELGATFEECVISLYNRDIKSNKPFSQSERYVLQTGQKLGLNETVVVQKHEILLGSAVDLSKSASSNGKAIKTGLSLSINEYNREKKKAQQSIQLIIRDNEYNPIQTREVVEEMQSQGVDMIITLLGSPTLLSVMDKIENGSMLFLFPSTGASIFRKPRLPGVIHFKASYRDQVFALMPQLIDHQFVKRFVFVYQNDAFGLSGMEPAREILNTYNIKEWTEIPYVRNVGNIQSIAEKIKAAQPEAVGIFLTASTAVELCKQLGIDVAMNLKMFGLDPLAESLFEEFVIKTGLKPLISHTVPNPYTSTLPIVQEYRDLMDKANKKYGDFSLEAFIDASLFIYAIQNLKGPISQQAVRTFFEQIKDVDFKGLRLNFDPVTRTLFHNIWISDGTNSIQVTDPEQLFLKKQRII